MGAGTGALLGTAAGAIVGGTTSVKTRKAMLIGAGLGALAGGGVGLYMDNQEAKLRERLRGTGVSVTRVGDNIILNMPSNITFDTDQADIKPNFYDTLNSVSLVLQEFNQTLVDVNGHTDSDGSAEYNYDLSRQRAGSVAQYLVSQRVNSQRFSVQGFGESQPIASNGSSGGKAQNRRVEIQIVPLT
ncbi:MAG: OmpA family protein [Rhizobiales bacterium]|nr:OmpA family protein [Hyphomicrobiales bacterium]